MTDRRSLLLTLGLLPWTGLRAHVEHENWDVVVIGSGAAGLSAAAAASESGLRVLVLEKQGTVGGSSRIASSRSTAHTGLAVICPFFPTEKVTSVPCSISP